MIKCDRMLVFVAFVLWDDESFCNGLSEAYFVEHEAFDECVEVVCC